LIQSIARYCKVYKNREKGIKREYESILYCITSQVCSLHENVGPIYRIQYEK